MQFVHFPSLASKSAGWNFPHDFWKVNDRHMLAIGQRFRLENTRRQTAWQVDVKALISIRVIDSRSDSILQMTGTRKRMAGEEQQDP